MTRITIQFYAVGDNYTQTPVPRTMHWETKSQAQLYFDKAIRNDSDGRWEAHLCINGESVQSKRTNLLIEG